MLSENLTLALKNWTETHKAWIKAKRYSGKRCADSCYAKRWVMSDANCESNILDSDSNIPVYNIYESSSINNYEMASWIITATFVDGRLKQLQ
jgi:hypothetical protein